MVCIPCVVLAVLSLKYAARSRYGGDVAVVLFVFCCIVRENLLLSSSVASVVSFGVFRDASEAPNRPSWLGHRGCGAVLVGVAMWGEALVIVSLSAVAATDISRIPVRDSRSSVSVASVLNSQVAVGLNFLLGPFPVVPSESSFHMESVSLKSGVGVSVASRFDMVV